MLAVVAALLVGVSKTGIGGLGVLVVAVFALIIPSTKQSTGIVLPLLIFGDTVAVLAYRRHAQWKYLCRAVDKTGRTIDFLLRAHRDHAASQFQLGVMYCTGQGVVQDLAKGVAWYEQAAHLGHLVAQYNLAVMISKGQGRPVDWEKAMEWFLRAAERDMPEAQIAAADALMSGAGVLKDPEAAKDWYRRAAQLGNEVAVRRLKPIE